MKVKLNKLVVVGSFTAAVLSSQAFAVSDPTVVFNARLVAATCNLDVSKKNISLGTHATSDIKDIKTALAEDNFNLILNNCTKIYAAEDGDLVPGNATEVSLYAKGNPLTGHSELFANEEASQIGVKLTTNNINILPNTDTPITDLKITGDKDYMIPVTAGLYATTKDADVQKLNTSVTFSVAYD